MMTDSASLSTLINMDTRSTSTTSALSANGLEDVVAATTRLSDVDGAAGRLVIAGASVEELAGHASFEEVLYRLWHGRAPSTDELAGVRARLGEAREAAFERLGELGDALAAADPMDALRASIAHLGGESDERPAPDEGPSLRLVGAVAVMAAAWARQERPLAPDPAAAHAADYLRMVRGSAAPPPRSDVDALDAYLVAVVDHGMNASTFAARVVASTGSDRVSAVVAALGALKGRLHGGAPGPVLDMLDAIGEPARAREWLEAALARRERIMGMGHRVYRVRDPRAFVLEQALARLEAARGESGPNSAPGRLALARAIEREAEALLAARHPDRPLRANVEFYTAVLLEAVGLPRALFTPTFAVSRVAGWCAHVDEQRAVGRLIRPKSRYVEVSP
jgi:citrate synthase